MPGSSLADVLLIEDNQPETCERAASPTKLCSKSLLLMWIWREAAVPLTESP